MGKTDVCVKPALVEGHIWLYPLLSKMSMSQSANYTFPYRHLLGIEGLTRIDIEALLALADEEVSVSRQIEKKKSVLRGRTQINLFFEPSTRTQSSFELAGKRLGADVMNMSVSNSSTKKGETLIDTAMTLNAMRPDLIVVRHHAAGAVQLLARKVDCSVLLLSSGQRAGLKASLSQSAAISCIHVLPDPT
jgi:aspartate carbamoyltransferase catalytic subunit